MMEEKLNYSHVMEEHVDVTDQDLINRIVLGTFDCKYDGISKFTASRFTDKKTAIYCIEKTLAINESAITEWLKYAAGKRFVVSANCLSPIGKGYVKGTRFSDGGYKMHRCIIVLEADAHYRDYRIVTAYPAPNAATTKKIQKDREMFCKRRA